MPWPVGASLAAATAAMAALRAAFCRPCCYGTIISVLQVLTGTAKGVRLRVPRGGRVRPTTGRVRQSIFGRLGPLGGTGVLDLFSGTGALGIEALSRGAARAVFVERDPAVCAMLRDNLRRCSLLGRAVVVCSDYRRAVARLRGTGERFDVVFVDPPYPIYDRMPVERFVTACIPMVGPGGVLVIKHPSSVSAEVCGSLDVETRGFGDTNVSFIYPAGVD